MKQAHYEVTCNHLRDLADQSLLPGDLPRHNFTQGGHTSEPGVHCHCAVHCKLCSVQCAVFSVQSIIQGSKYSDPLLEGLPQASMPEIGQRIRLSKGDILQVGAIVTKLPRSSVYDDAAWDNDDPYDEGDDDHDYNENFDDPILDTRISVLLLLRPSGSGYPP